MRLADRLGVDRENAVADLLRVPARPTRAAPPTRTSRRGLRRFADDAPAPGRVRVGTRCPDRARPRASRPRERGAGARGSGRPPVSENGARAASAPRGRLRGGRRCSPTGWGFSPSVPGPPRPPVRALGRPRAARPCEGRGDPAADADRPPRRRCRLPTHARRRRARRAPRPRARRACVRPGGGRLPRRRCRADPGARRARVGVGGDARVRAATRG